MCTSPVYIVNPVYAQKAYFYPFLHLNGDEKYYRPSYTEKFDYRSFSKYLPGLNHDNYQKYVACNIAGECIDIFMECACGKCPSCIKTKQIDLCNCMTLEQYSHKSYPIFITLTYDNDHLPHDGVSVYDCQLFFKRLRWHLENKGFNPKFRYACFSEYGKLHGRPHYHIICYGIGSSCASDFLRFKNCVSDSWTLGICDVRLCNTGAFSYVSKYVVKGSNVPPKQNPNFRLASRRSGGLGVPAFNSPEIYQRYLLSPNGIITVNVLGKDVDVYIPKCIRRSVFKTLNSAVPRKVKKHIQRLIYQSSILHSCIMHNNGYEFVVDNICNSYCNDSCLVNSIRDCVRNILPRWLVEKFPMVDETWMSNICPSYYFDFCVASASLVESVTYDIINLVKFLRNYEFDFHFYLENMYIRELVIDPLLRKLTEFKNENSLDVQKAIDSLYINRVNACFSKDYQ